MNNIQFINHSQLERCLMLLWMADIPACIIGGVGCGKTTAVEGLVKKLDAKEEFIKQGGFHMWKIFLGLVDATEVGGIPFRDPETGAVDYAPPKVLPYNSDKCGIIFGDEYDRAPPDVQNAFNQILLGREIHGNKISHNAYVVLAMNGDSDKYTTPLSQAAANRVCTLFLSSRSSGTLEDWDKYAIEQNINPTIRAFAHCRTDLIENHDDTFAELALITPRSRDQAGSILDACEKAKFKTDDILLPCLNGVIGSGAANELLQFIRMKDELPDIGHMINNPLKYKDHEVFRKNDRMYMLSIAVASYVEMHEDVAGKAIDLMSLAPPEIRVWAIKSIVETCPKAAATDEYSEFFKATQDLII